MTRFREAGLFFLCSISICFAVFRGGFWGSAILAPVDIAPTIFSKYRYIDPSAGDVPANHYIIDQLTYDLPLQHTIYQAYRRGEIPWWDPYTYAGRPLLADAHINAGDPIRILCYLTLPFVPAYNWNLILKSILTGLGMFLLLRQLGFTLPISLPLALTYQFAGCFAIFFGHPWIQASFVWYPFLWMTWFAGSKTSFLYRAAIGAVLCAFIFYSGNLQSHVYLALFAVCFLAGHWLADRRLPARLLVLISLPILAGAALAAPVLWPEIELYLNSVRTATTLPGSHLTIVAGILSLSAVFPWTLGTFRTLDFSKIFGLTGLGFVLFTGSAAFIIALLGLAENSATALRLRRAKFVAITLLVAYFVACSTPLLRILYTRLAPMAVMAIIVLAAAGLATTQERCFPKLGLTVAGGAVAMVILLNFAAFVIYPRYIDRVRAFVAARDKMNPTFSETPALRSFQVSNLPREISVQNPETVLAFVSLIALAIYLRRPRPRPFAKVTLLALNFLPLIFFFSRYVPNYPVTYWERLLAGGSEQRRVADTVNPDHLRLLEKPPSPNDTLFPNNMGHLQQVHTVHGYSALQPASLYHWPSGVNPPQEPVADFMYSSKERGSSTGELTRLTDNDDSRVRCDRRNVSITAETLNSLTLSIAPGPAGELLRTDTFYPGWSAQLNGNSIPLGHAKLPFSMVELPPDETVATVTYYFRPTYAAATTWFAVVASLLVTAIALGGRKS